MSGKTKSKGKTHKAARACKGIFKSYAELSTCTISLRTRIAPRWMAFLGFGLAALLLLSVGVIDWIPLVFPAWVLLVSTHILIENLRLGLGRQAWSQHGVRHDEDLKTDTQSAGLVAGPP